MESNIPGEAKSPASSASSPREALELERHGVDPQRISLHRLGWPQQFRWRGYPPWVRPMIAGVGLWAMLAILAAAGLRLPPILASLLDLLIGLLILESACEALVTATERFAAQRNWDHYVAGTLSEILSTLPELVVIAFVIPVSPVAAMVIALVTIYNNALVFSVYSYFLPKNQRGRFLMPAAITEAGTQILIAGAGLGSVIGLVMLVLSAGGHDKQAFSPLDLGALAVIMLGLFGVYVYMLIQGYASEEQAVRAALKLDAAEVEQRKERAYHEVKQTSLANIAWLFVAGIGAAVLGGQSVSSFADAAIGELDLNPIATAIVLAAFAGMSEYVIVWRAHRKGQHRIALANAFGGITQVMFLVLPFTLLAIGIYQGPLSLEHPELPLTFSVSNVLLFVLLFPTFFVLTELIEEDHTLSALDTAIMAAIFLLIILILVSYGS